MRRMILGGLLAVCTAQSAAADGLIRFSDPEIPWKAGPPSLPAGSQVAVLEGDPKSTGLFTMRVKLPAGARLAPHRHPNPERITVISGTVRLGYGEIFDDSKLTTFGAGSYYLTPPEMPHYAVAPEEAVLQVTTHGPWELRPVAAAKP